MKISRNESGQVNVNNKHAFRVPKNRSVFAVFGQLGSNSNEFDFCEDGWVRNKLGVKIKRWGGKVNGVRVNISKQGDIKYLCALHRKIKERGKKERSKLKLILQKIVDLGGEAHAIPTHIAAKKDLKNSCWMYKVENTKEYGRVFGFEWQKFKTKDSLVNLDLGQQLYHQEHVVCGSWGKRRFVLDAVIKEYFVNQAINQEKPKSCEEFLFLRHEEYGMMFNATNNGFTPPEWELTNNNLVELGTKEV